MRLPRAYSQDCALARFVSPERYQGARGARELQARAPFHEAGDDEHVTCRAQDLRAVVTVSVRPLGRLNPCRAGSPSQAVISRLRGRRGPPRCPASVKRYTGASMLPYIPQPVLNLGPLTVFFLAGFAEALRRPSALERTSVLEFDHRHGLTRTPSARSWSHSAPACCSNRPSASRPTTSSARSCRQFPGSTSTGCGSARSQAVRLT